MILQTGRLQIISLGTKSQGSEDEKPEDEEAGKKNSTTSTADSKESSWISRAKTAGITALKIWQILSMAIIFILDVRYFVDHVKEHPDESGWAHYNCLTQIAVSSSNFKDLIVNLLPLYARLQIDQRLLVDDIRADSDPPALVLLGHLGKHTLCLTRGIMKVNLESLYIVVMLFAAAPLIPTLFTHLLPAALCYIWVLLLVEIALFCLLLGLVLCCTKCCPKRVLFLLVGLPIHSRTGDEDTDDIVSSEQKAKVQTDTLKSVEVQAVAVVEVEEVKVDETNAVTRMGLSEMEVDEVCVDDADEVNVHDADDVDADGVEMDGPETGEPEKDLDGTERRKRREAKAKRTVMTFNELMESPLSVIGIIIACLMIPTLSQSYWYSGDMNYIDSLVQVLTERYVRQYFTHVTGEFTSTFRFLTTIL